MMKNMTKLLILMLAGFIAGCATQPPVQSVEEMREEMRSGLSGIQMEEYEVERPFIIAYNAVQINAERCFEVTVTKRPDNDPEARVESMRYRSDSLMISETAGETSLQLDKKDSGKMPEGGYYVLFADIEAMSSNKTRVTIYKALRGYENVNGAIVGWAEGSSDACPPFPKEATDWRVTYHNP
jgi:hypothetical protein